MKVVVVESPAKAKTINKYLGRGLRGPGLLRPYPRPARRRTARSIRTHDFRMIWEVEGRGAKRVSEIAKAVKGAEKLILATDPDREGEAISWHVLEALNEKRALKGMPVERVTFNAITKDAVQTAHAPAARDRPGAGRRLSGPPRARLSRRLHPLAGALAQAARRPLGRPRAVGGAAPRLRPRARDRDLPAAANTGRSSRRSRRRTARVFDARLVGADGKKITAPRHRQGRGGGSLQARPRARDLHGRERRGEARQAPPLRRPSRPRPCSRRPRASSASRRRRPCASRSGSTRASTSAARRSASSPICAPTASTWRPEARAGRAPRHRQGIRRPLRARRAAPLHDQGQERPGGARGDPPDRHGPPAGAGARASRARAGAALRADLEPHHREPDGIGRARAHHRRHRRDGRPAQARPARHRPGREVRRLPHPLPGGPGRRRRTRTKAACRRCSTAIRWSAARIAATQHFTEPPPRYSEASLVKRMEELGIGRPSTYAAILRPCATANTCASRRSASSPRTRAASSPPSWRASSSATSSTTSPPTSRSSSTASPTDEIDWKEVLRDFWRDFSAAIGETKELRTTEVLDALNELLGAAHLPRPGRRLEPAHLPDLRQRASSR